MNFALPDMFYEVNIVSVFVRLCLALIIGGVIGLERGASKHQAGFRTHILVCVGAALVMMTNQYCYDNFYTAINNGDVVRLGAQVITGVGFLGAGTIIVAGRERIKGLTTAAGLWASACIGLACGIGFYSGAIVGALLIFIALALLPGLEHHVYRHSRSLNIYIEVDTVHHMKNVKHYIRDIGGTDIEAFLVKSGASIPSAISFNITATLPKGTDDTKLRHEIEKMNGVILVENF